MSKKTLSLAVLMSMATTGAFAASNTSVPMTTAAVDTALVTTSVNNGTKLSKYQEEAIRMTQAAMANKQANDAGTYPSAISVDAPKTVQLALENNRTAKQSAWDYESKKAAVNTAAASKNPSLGYGYSGTKTNGDNDGTKSGHSFSLSVPVFAPATDAAIHGARYDREGAGAAYEEALQQAKYDAVNGYYTLIKDRNAVDVARQSVTDYNGHLTNVQAQYNVGLVANSDVMSSKTDLADAQTKLVTAQNTADLAETSLNTVLALPVSTKIDTADKSLNYTPYNVTLDQAKAYALVHRAQLVQSAMSVKSAEESLKAAKDGYLPTISASLGKSLGNNSGWSGTGDTSSWSIGAKADWTIWNGGATQSKIKAAEAAFEKAKEANLATVDKVMSDVQSAYLKLRAAEQTINSTQTAVESAQEAFRIQSLRYRAGVGANIDVLDAETKLTSARNSYLDALYDYNVAGAQLEQYVGVPLETPVGAGAALIASNESANTLAALTQTTTTK